MRVLALLCALLIALPAAAQVKPSPQIEARAATLVALLRDGMADAEAFTPPFLAQVPVAQLEAIALQFRTANGAVVRLASIESENADQAIVAIEYEQSIVRARISLEPATPHRFIGLLITGVTRKGDSFDAIKAAFAKLSGRSALLVTKLGDPAAQPIVALQPDAPFATGSVFKLFVLAELARSTEAETRKWSDVVPLGPPSLPSGVTQDWPQGTPMTLATLATQMISISDNTATDTLIAALGRPQVDAMRASIGSTPGSLPVLTTLDAFVLKMPTREALRKRWTSSGLSDRNQVLNELEPTIAAVDYRAFAGPPLHIDSVEWPATMREIVGVLDFLRRGKNREARDILAVAPGIAPNERARFAYAGYKGGSESGVIAMSWLLRSKAGDWYAVAAAWNDPAAPVDNKAFEALMGRVIALTGR